MTGEEMRQLRQSLKLTQIDLASLLRSTQTRISRLERTKTGVLEEVAYVLRYLWLERQALDLVAEFNGPPARNFGEALESLGSLLRTRRRASDSHR